MKSQHQNYYKIGQQVIHEPTNGIYYIVGMQGNSLHAMHRHFMLIIHQEKDTPSRKGYKVHPSEVTVIGKV